MKMANKLGGNPLSQFRLLIADNDARLLQLMKQVLTAFGFMKIELCHDGSSALQKANLLRYDIIMCDWQMQGVNGLDFVKHIRGDETHQNIFTPIIMLSGRAERENIEAARDAGVTEFLAKPFTLQTLRTRLIAVIEGPREFVFTPSYIGPSRRRRTSEPPAGVDRRA